MGPNEYPRWRWHAQCVRYSLAYVSAAFLVSVPLRLILKESEGFITFSLVYGVVAGIAALLFTPIGQIDWKHMTVPRFKVFELEVARNATLVSGVLLAGRLISSRYFPPLELGSVVFMLMAFSYLKAKAHRIIFKEFYSAEAKPPQPGSGCAPG